MVWVDSINEGLTTATQTQRYSFTARLVTFCLGFYLLVSVALVAVIRISGERWWPATVLMFGPRWVWGVPLVVLIPAALCPGRRRVNLTLAAVSLLVVAKLLLGFCVPWRAWADRMDSATPASALHLRVMTCNIHAAFLNETAAADLIDRTQPDVVAFEEWFGKHSQRLGRAPGGGRWHVLQDGELRLQSRYPIRHGPIFFDHGWGGGAAGEFVLLTPAGPVPLVVLHFASPHNAISNAVRLHPTAEAKLQGNSWVRGAQAGSVSDFAARAGNAVLVVGDFNMPADSELFRRDFSDFDDAFASAGWGFGWTYFARGTAVRIDHVLSGSAWRTDACHVGAFIGSPHRPVIADLTLLTRPGSTTQP